MAKIIYKVPACSQYLDVKNKRWQDNACGIVALYEILDFFLGKDRVASLPRFIKEAMQRGAYSAKSGGWAHKGLVELAQAYGLNAQAYDLAKARTVPAFGRFIKELKEGPVLVSIYKDFDTEKSGHLIVATGYEKAGNKVTKIFYNESATRRRVEMRTSVSKEKFLSGWKKRFITFHKPQIKLLLFDNYLRTIRKSVNSTMFQSVYVIRDGLKTDITRYGELSCAVYVSSILVMFNLIGSRHATVRGMLGDMEQAGWRKIKRPKEGAIIVWGPWEKSDRDHTGFYIGKNMVISNDSKKRVPARHHWTYSNKRKVESIWWNKKLDI